MGVRPFEQRVSRRALLRRSATGASGLGALALIGCSGSDGGPPPTSTAAPSPTAQAPSPTASASSAPLAWAQVVATGAPSPRRDHSLTYNSDDGMLYAFGGRAGGVPTDELWRFDPATRAWSPMPTSAGGPAARFGHNALYDAERSRLIVALGQGDGGAFFDDVWSYDEAGWRRIDGSSNDRPEVRYGAGSAFDADGGRLLVSHGFTDRGRFSDTWTFDFADDTWRKIGTSGDVPIKRCLTRCLWLPASSSMLLFGGQTDDTPFLGDLWELDVTRKSWARQAAPALPGARNLYGAALDSSGARWYVVSGNTPDGPVAETWAYDLPTRAWVQLAPTALPPARYSADAAVAGTMLYLFAGHDGNTELGDLWALSLA